MRSLTLRSTSCALIAILAISSKSGADPAATKDYRVLNREAALRLRDIMRACPDRIWRDYSWRELNVVFIDNVKSAAQTALSVADDRIFEISTSEIPAASLRSHYNFYRSPSGRQWMSIHTDLIASDRLDLPEQDLVERVIRLSIHEGFHQVGQSGWRIRATVRGTELPIHWEPRFYRSLLFDALKGAYLEPARSEEQLSAAKYWYSRWSTEFPQETLSTTDGYEGTARYSDIMALGLTKLGCAAEESRLHDTASSIVRSELGAIFSGEYFSFDAEGYDLGAIASLLLRRDADGTDWREKVAEGYTPLAILLASRPPAPAEEPADRKLKFVKAADHFQAEAKRHIGNTPALLARADSVFINIPGGWFEGSYSPIAFYVDSESGAEYIPMLNELIFKNGRSAMKSKPKAVFTRSLSSPCSNDAWQLVVPPTSALISGSSKLTIRDPHFEGRLYGAKKLSTSGKTWFCAGD